MLIGELLERLQEESMKEICADLGVHQTTVQRKLRKVGFEYDNVIKMWYWPDEEKEQPIDVNILDLVNKPTNKNVHKNANNDVPEVVNNNKNNVAVDPADEIDDILNDDNKNVKVQKGIYFETDVARALDKLVRKKKQSELVNAATRQVLKAKGLL